LRAASARWQDAAMDEARLAATPLFSSLSRRKRRELSAHADEVNVDEGRRLVREGAFSYEFFVIEEGTAEVLRGDEHVADLGPGDFFGEMGLAGDLRRNASVVATSPMTLIVMTGRDFRHMARRLPDVAEQIERAIAQRTKPLADAK
jgi:CRP/FNR family cyclic AMP-dependent transcriptional regulator